MNNFTNIIQSAVWSSNLQTHRHISQTVVPSNRGLLIGYTHNTMLSTSKTQYKIIKHNILQSIQNVNHDNIVLSKSN